MKRVTEKHLKGLVTLLNVATGQGEGLLKGVYALDYAYGGVRLVQFSNNEGAINVISTGGYGTKRELKTFLDGMLNALKNQPIKES